jgi:hypothetical protein
MLITSESPHGFQRQVGIFRDRRPNLRFGVHRQFYQCRHVSPGIFAYALQHRRLGIA